MIIINNTKRVLTLIMLLFIDKTCFCFFLQSTIYIIMSGIRHDLSDYQLKKYANNFQAVSRTWRQCRLDRNCARVLVIAFVIRQAE